MAIVAVVSFSKTVQCALLKGTLTHKHGTSKKMLLRHKKWSPGPRCWRIKIRLIRSAFNSLLNKWNK